jgi:hypothetical protein
MSPPSLELRRDNLRSRLRRERRLEARDYPPSASDNVPFCWILPSRLAGFGGKGIRTPDFQLAKLAFCQVNEPPLPVRCRFRSVLSSSHADLRFIKENRLEPTRWDFGRRFCRRRGGGSGRVRVCSAGQMLNAACSGQRQDSLLSPGNCADPECAP